MLRREVEGAKFAEVGGAEFGKFIEELGERLPCTFAVLGSAVEGFEGARLAVVEDHASARHPVHTLAVVEVADDVVGSERRAAFVLRGPGFGEFAQESVEGRGSTGEQGEGLIQVVFHGNLQG